MKCLNYLNHDESSERVYYATASGVVYVAVVGFIDVNGKRMFHLYKCDENKNPKDRMDEKYYYFHYGNINSVSATIRQVMQQFKEAMRG